MSRHFKPDQDQKYCPCGNGREPHPFYPKFAQLCIGNGFVPCPDRAQVNSKQMVKAI